MAAAARAVPGELIEQLVEGGRLLVPVGQQDSKRKMAWRMLCRCPAAQRLHRYVRRAQGYECEVLEGVNFVPFIGSV